LPATNRTDRQSDRSKPKLLPPYAVIVLNDDVHSFDYVVSTFQKVFGYPLERAFQLASQIHNTGLGQVWSGSKEVAELKCEQIRGAGPDVYAAKKVEFPLGTYIEPLPG
jgi:ATP-dependent Clp protease adaptor protein ClpS